MFTTLPTLERLDERRRDLKMSVTALARRSHISRPIVNRILSGQELSPSLQSLQALAAALGLHVQLGNAPAIVEAMDAREFRRQQAQAKARRLAQLVQGTMGLEGQAVDSKTLGGLIDENVHALLSGSARQLWDDEAMLGPIIPGETPLDDISGLKIAGITTRAELNRHEAENINRAVLKYLASRPTRRSARFDFTWCLKLHREMLGNVWKWAGEVRTIDLNLGSPFHRISSDLQQLLDDLHSWPEFKRDLVEQSARLHHRAVQIHPFLNGNGRWSRMLANIWLKQQRSPLIVWPEETVGDVSTIRAEYLTALRAADNLDYLPLIALHRRHVDTAR